VIYSASVVNFYNATGSLARFENKNILFSFEKHSSLLQRWRCSCKFKKIVGLAPGADSTTFVFTTTTAALDTCIERF
jgi:hypothetical protein